MKVYQGANGPTRSCPRRQGVQRLGLPECRPWRRIREGTQLVPDSIRRLREVAVLDTLGLENSIARARTLAYLATTAIKLMEVGELEPRLASLESAVQGTKVLAEPVFDVEPVGRESTVEVES